MSWVSPPVIATGALVTAAMWNSNFSYLYDSGWLVLSAVPGGFTNSWVSQGGPGAGATAAYRKIGNVVRFGGAIASGSAAGVCVMPSGYFPTYTAQMSFNTFYGAIGPGAISVTGIGQVNVAFAAGVSSANFVPLDDMTYTVD